MACFSKWDIGGCGCVSTCTQTFTIQACGGLAYSGLTVSVYTASGGTLLASGVTNGSGLIALTWSGSSGAYWVTITGQSARFAAYAQSLTLTCGGSQTIAVPAATGYQCDCAASGCFQPIATTLHLTDGVYGPVTLTYSTRTITIAGGTPTNLTGWWGTISVSYSGCAGVCAAGTATLDYYYSCGQVNIYGNCNNPAGASGYCLYTGAGLFTYLEVGSTQGQARTWTCPPSFDFASTAVETSSSLLYCFGTGASITVTE